MISFTPAHDINITVDESASFGIIADMIVLKAYF